MMISDLSTVRRSLATWTLAACAAFAVAGCRNPPITNLERLAEARQLSADMLVQFTKAVDAGNRAVMADTDETSVAFVREAEEATNAVVKDRDSLEPVLRDMDYRDETRLLADFDARFGEYRALERSILDLAVENTNLKAQRLSFGPAQETADAFRDALLAVVPPAKTEQAWHVQALVATAVADVREIQVLQAPHIAESDEAAMTKLEERVADREASARRSIEALAGLVRPDARPQLALAAVALDRFTVVNAQLVALSRRNSNVRSLALSLGQKRTLTATCEERLRALQEALAKRGFTATK